MQQLVIANPWKHAPVYYTESTDSTMEDVLALERAGAPGGTVLVAGYQRRGRGRFPERSWNAEAGSNLLFTLLLKQALSFPPQRLPVLAGLAVSLVVEELFGLETLIKWPNDLLYEGRKLAGILCQAHGQAYLVGIGLNCNQRRFPPDLAEGSCSLLQLLEPAGEIDRFLLLEHILAAIEASLADENWKRRLLGRLYGLGQELTVCRNPSGTAPQEMTGRLEDIADDGALLLRLEEGGELVALRSGEIRKT